MGQIMKPITFDSNNFNYYVSEINREQYSQQQTQNSGLKVPSENENIFSARRINPIERTGETSTAERTSKYVENPSLYASLNAMGTGEHSPSKYDEFSGNKLDIWG